MITREDIFYITKETKKLQSFFEKGDLLQLPVENRRITLKSDNK